ncbi:hypothetical protein Leryth_022869 [Lithospermum erythrorhizon]|nr:hypothetical protein Leryth_022869 [Lithospermum erythrorhizon]
MKNKVVVVILVGPPGSGKSTFCEDVMKDADRPWSRICQDTIARGGKAGTRSQCLSSATSALNEGSSVLIDRCNIDKEQRADFLKLGGDEVEKHCVFLDLPAKVCISRAMKRTDHEGKLQGGKAAAVVNRVLQKKELPELSEGFTRIMRCANEEHVEAAIVTYRGLGLVGTLPSGYFGQKSPGSKVQLGIMRFMKKVDPPANLQSKSDDPQDMSQDKVSLQKVSVNKEKISPTHSDVENDVPLRMSQDEVSVQKVSVCKEEDSCPAHSDVRNNEKLDSAHKTSATENVPALAFPSISTADFHFDLEKASNIIVEKVEEYINELGNARLVLVDISPNSKILASVRRKIAQRNIDSSKFFTFVGDITQLYSRGGLQCNVIANATNWRLKPGGGGVNAAIFSAAGPELESATKERATSLQPGNSVVVPISSTSPLFIREGVTHVVHVLGPNMNPQRPDCLKNDYVKGCNVLRKAYSSLFEAFVSIVRPEGASLTPTIDKSLETQDHLYRSPGKGHQKVSGREALDQPQNNKRYKGFYKELGTEVFYSDSKQEPPNIERTKGMSKTWASYAQALHNIAMHPDRHKKDVIELSDDVVVINDLYPKAQKHLLVLARIKGLDSLADVDKEHLSLLNKMHHIGLKHAENLLKDDETLIFRMGYHSVPSMRQLHLHVISQDFNSNHLKNKKHWNSFTTLFFLDSVDVIEEVSRNGKPALIDDESHLKMELRCHRCRSVHPNIPRLKSHITSCQAPFPSKLQQNGRLIFCDR